MHVRPLGIGVLLPSLAAAALGLALAGCELFAEPALPVEDDFEGACSRWAKESSDRVSLGCEDGEYRIAVREADAHTAVLPIPETHAVAAEADVRLEHGPEWVDGEAVDVHGVSCWAGDEGYVFVVTADGYWAITKAGGSGYSILREAQTPLEAPDRGASVRVRGECAARTGGTALAISVDGRRLSVVHDAPGARRFDSVGLSVLTAVGGVEVRFDDFRATGLDESALGGLARDTGAGAAEPLRLVDESEFRIHVDDDFSDAESGWPRGNLGFASLAYARGAYAVALAGRPYHVVLRNVGETRAVAVEATLAQATRRADQAFGLACYTGDGSAGYIFALSGSTGYAIFAERTEQAAGERLDVVDRGAGPVARLAEPARLRAECAVAEDGTHLVLSVGGERWASAVDKQGIASLGAAGLYVSRERARTRVFFDDVVVRAVGEPGEAPVVEKDAPAVRPDPPPPAPPTRVLFRGEESEWTLDHAVDTARSRRGVVRLQFATGGLRPEPLAREVAVVRMQADVTDETRGRKPVEHGLACWHEGDGSPASSAGYVFTIDPGAGTYRIERWFGSAVAELEAGRARAAIRGRGRMNRIRIECRAVAGATRLALVVNGRRVVRHADARVVQVRTFDTLQYSTSPGATTRYERVRADELGPARG